MFLPKHQSFNSNILNAQLALRAFKPLYRCAFKHIEELLKGGSKSLVFVCIGIPITGEQPLAPDCLKIVAYQIRENCCKERHP